jgi:hypothetical protein
MSERPESEEPTGGARWPGAVARLLTCQWKLFETQYETGMKIMETLLDTPGGMTDELRRLEQTSAERVRKGLAPPPEIYKTPYRERIDWSRFPEWARPTDPELFEECAHEG